MISVKWFRLWGEINKTLFKKLSTALGILAVVVLLFLVLQYVVILFLD